MFSNIKPDFLIEGMSLENQGLYSLINSWPVFSGYKSGVRQAALFQFNTFYRHMPPGS